MVEVHIKMAVMVLAFGNTKKRSGPAQEWFDGRACILKSTKKDCSSLRMHTLLSIHALMESIRVYFISYTLFVERRQRTYRNNYYC